jgi:DNA-binding transcriptional ArsR family regulator
MDQLLHALAHQTRRQIALELRRCPGQKHGELLDHLGLGKRNGGNLTKLLAVLEEVGIVERTEGHYNLVDQSAVSSLLLAAAELDVSARKVLATRAQASVVDAEELARGLKAELSLKKIT